MNKDEHLRCSQSFPFLNFATHRKAPKIQPSQSRVRDSWRNITKISSGTGVGRFLHGTLSNMVAVHPLQVKEPSATVSQMSSLGSSSVGVDSILVEPTTSGASNKSTNTFWYFAIGSMMSPKSMENRNIVPLTSAPAELFDYELKFFGGMGFGEAVNKPGASFHGVLVSYRTYILHCYLCIFSMVYAPDIFSHYLRDFLHSLLVYSFMSTRLSYSAPCGY